MTYIEFLVYVCPSDLIEPYIEELVTHQELLRAIAPMHDSRIRLQLRTHSEACEG